MAAAEERLPWQDEGDPLGQKEFFSYQVNLGRRVLGASRCVRCAVQ